MTNVVILWAAFLSVSILVIVTPGPDTALTIRNTLIGGRRSGTLTAAGIAAGQATWTLATSAGVAALLVASGPAFAAVKLAGAAYLVFLGAQALRGALRSREPAGAVTAPVGPRVAPIGALRQGAISNLGNPGLPLDLHVDESDDAADLTLPHIARRARETDFSGRVVAGHCCSLAALPDADAFGVIAAVAESGVHVVTLPAVNLYFQGRADRQPVRRGVTRVRELLAAGVNVAAGSDNVRDPFYPFGDGDLLRLAALTCSVAHLPGLTGMATALAMVTDAPARAIGLAPKYGLRPGAWADLVVLDLPGPAGPEHVLSRQPGRYLILCGGVPSVAPPALRFASQGAPD